MAVARWGVVVGVLVALSETVAPPSPSTPPTLVATLCHTLAITVYSLPTRSDWHCSLQHTTTNTPYLVVDKITYSVLRGVITGFI
jgi:hypothetical protein